MNGKLIITFASAVVVAGAWSNAQAQACSTGASGSRVIAYNTVAGPCPAVLDYTVGSLFPAGAPAPLDRFCAYSHAVRPQVDFDNNVPGTLVDSAPDCLVAMPQQLTPAPQASLHLADALAPLHASSFANAIGAHGDGLAHVPVDVLDTLPAAEPANAHSPHGAGMVAIARLAAGNDAAVSARLAMGRVAGGAIDAALGGYHGTVGDLAVALYASVAAHPAGQPGIINLSLGWRAGELGGHAQISQVMSESIVDPATNETGVAGPVRAVHAALALAACRDLLVVSAAGNVEAGPDDDGTGALLPAGWQTLDARCDGQSVGPLVFAAGGVDLTGSPIANARIGAEPTLVTYAEEAAVVTANGVTWSMTGTSVAAAVVSGIASRLWSDLPELDRGAFIAALTELSEDGLGRQASLCAGDECPEVRMLRACHASPEAECEAVREGRSTLETITAVEEEHVQVSISGRMQPPVDDPTDVSVLAGIAVSPQPSTPVCPSCPAQRLGTTTLKVWVTLGLPVLAPKIVAVDSANNPVKTLTLPSTVTPGKLSVVYVTGVPTNAHAFRVEGKYKGAVHSSTLKLF